MRLDLDMQFVFTANPEDYTNRESIVTPLNSKECYVLHNNYFIIKKN